MWSNSLAMNMSGDRIICGTNDGQVHILSPVNFPPSAPPILTAIHHDIARCLYCASEFTPSPEVVAAIQQRSAPPYPDEAFDDPRLLIGCPHCGKPLKFNPFFVETGKREP